MALPPRRFNSPALIRGTWVEHIRHGPGAVLETRYLGAEVRVRFSDHVRWVAARDLRIFRMPGRPVAPGREPPLPDRGPDLTPPPRPAAAPRAAPAAATRPGRPMAPAAALPAPAVIPLRPAPRRAEPRPARPAPADVAQPRRPGRLWAEISALIGGGGVRPAAPGAAPFRNVVEAFRLGIVPAEAVQDWTVGRDREVGDVLRWLHDETEGSLILEGAYGTGKTHLLRYLEAEALRRRYMVASVRLDPGQANGAFPFRLWGQIVRSTRVPLAVPDEPVSAAADSATPPLTVDLREALERTVRLRPHELQVDHFLLGPFLLALQADTLSADDWAAFHGESRPSEHFPFAKDYTTVANVVCNTLTALSHVAVEQLGLAGYLLLVDEVETTDTFVHRYHWTRSLNLLRGLTLAANDEPVLLEEAVVREPDHRTGQTTRLVYSGHHPVPYLWRVPSHLKVVLALTPGHFRGVLRAWRESQPLIELNAVSRQDLAVLYGRFVQAYRQEFGIRRWSVDDLRLFNFLYTLTGTSGSTRTFLKALVEALDFVRRRPDDNPLAHLHV